LQRDLIYVLADLGAFYLLTEDFPKARDYSEQSIALADRVKGLAITPGGWPDDYGRARALLTLGEIDLRDGNHEQAIDKLERSLKLYQQLNGQGSSYEPLIAGVYSVLAKVYPEMGDYNRALFYLNKALEITRSSDQETVASLLNSIGYLYMEQEDYEQAKAKFDESLKIYRLQRNQREESRVLLNLGVIEQRQANYDGALAQFKLSLDAAKATQLTDVQIAAGEGIGVVLAAKREFDAALRVLNESLTLAKDIKDRTRQTELLWRSAQVRYEMGDYSQSSELARAALDLARAAHLPKLTYLSTTTLGEAYVAQNKVELATQTLKDAVEQADAMRYQVAGREVERQLFFKNKVPSYHALIDLLIKQGRLVDAFLFGERAKGRVLLDVLNGAKVNLAKALTATEKKETERLNTRKSHRRESRSRATRSGISPRPRAAQANSSDR
jgi:tetratricopeptide (TPR) repeat protein